MITLQTHPNKEELVATIDEAFSCLLGEDNEAFTQDTSQSLPDWFDVDAMLERQKAGGKLLESRDENGKLFGVAFVDKQHAITWPDGKKAEIFLLAVLPSARGKGAGKELLAACEEHAKAMGAKTLVVNTNSVMKATLRFYEHTGFEVMGTLTGYYGNGNAVFMKKTL